MKKLLVRCPPHVKAILVSDETTRNHVRGTFTFKFGKYRGLDFDEVFQINPKYFLWLVEDLFMLQKYNKPVVVNRIVELANAAKDELIMKNRENDQSEFIGPEKGRAPFTFKIISMKEVVGRWSTICKYKCVDSNGNRIHANSLENLFNMTPGQMQTHFIDTDKEITVIASVCHSE